MNMIEPMVKSLYPKCVSYDVLSVSRAGKYRVRLLTKQNNWIESEMWFSNKLGKYREEIQTCRRAI